MDARCLPLVAVLAAAGSAALGQGDPLAGERLYQSRCTACHSMEYNGVGPTHRNLVGRRAGTVAGYSYSQALKASTVVWNADSLSRWLPDPEKFIPGQQMFFSVPDDRERADIVAYLLQAGRQQAPSNQPPGK